MRKRKPETLDVMDYRAILYAQEIESQGENWQQTWHYCKCNRCKKKMSLLEAAWDESFAPVHKICPK